MTIVDELKKLVIVRGGETAGIRTIADAVRVLTQLEEQEQEDDPSEP